MLAPTLGLVFAAVMLVQGALMCINISISTRRHDAKMKEMEKNRPPLTLAKLREELKPENLEQSRTKMLRLLQSMSPTVHFLPSVS